MTRVSQTRGSGAGQGESTRDPGPTHLKTYLEKENTHTHKKSDVS